MKNHNKWYEEWRVTAQWDINEEGDKVMVVEKQKHIKDVSIPPHMADRHNDGVLNGDNGTPLFYYLKK